jgi:hypothetical protein
LEFEKKRAEAEAATEAKTAKNRSKRQKKKERARKGAGQAGGEGSAEPDEREGNGAANEAPAKKRKLGAAGDAVVTFRTAEQRAADEDEDEEEGRPTGDTSHEERVQAAVEATEETARPVAADAGISIVVDDE